MRSLNAHQTAAFNAWCVSLLDSQLKLLGTNAKSPSERLSGEIGYEQMVIDVRDALESCARGLTSAPSAQLTETVKCAVGVGKQLKADKGNWDKKNWKHYAANTEHLYYHIPLQIALSCLEAIRLNAFETMTSLLASIKTSAICRCDGDPFGAVNMEIQDSMVGAVPEIRRAYLYMKAFPKPPSDQSPTVFPRGFLTDIGGFNATDVPDSDLITGAEADGDSTSTGAKKQTRDPTKDGISNTFEFQVFISFKNLGANGHPTEDSILAEELYRFLTSRGLTVFFSHLSLEKLGQSAYSKAIDDALDSAQILIAVSTNPNHLESDWVRYEWDSFYNDIISQIKPNGRIFSYVKGLTESQLPRKLRQQQVFHHERDERESLCNFINNALI